MNVTAYVECRAQKSRGSGNGKFGGPDTYYAVQIVPDGEAPLRYLNSVVARNRGIQIVYCGEGYSHRTKTLRSSLRQAQAEAERIADGVNSGALCAGCCEADCDCGVPA